MEKRESERERKRGRARAPVCVIGIDKLSKVCRAQEACLKKRNSVCEITVSRRSEEEKKSSCRRAEKKDNKQKKVTAAASYRYHRDSTVYNINLVIPIRYICIFSITANLSYLCIFRH